ncbi:ubiquitin-protein ligase Anaphase Promoting Complex [Paraconiothyrium brasiliense]|uniref:Ubiquitin-protein ligase Anaphase Promoting Complex n=1 Tax=Paraconiothyrium brasiliense TaxID=300254 RepID=A0ABR3QL09_9PLEO
MSFPQNLDITDPNNPLRDNTSHQSRYSPQLLLTDNSEIAFGGTAMSNSQSSEETQASPEYVSDMYYVQPAASALQLGPPYLHPQLFSHTFTPPNGHSSAVPASSAAQVGQYSEWVESMTDWIMEGLEPEVGRIVDEAFDRMEPEVDRIVDEAFDRMAQDIIRGVRQGLRDRGSGEDDAHALPSREHFLNPNNASGLLALSDTRTDARPQDVCSVCQGEFENLSDAVVIVACGHIYHRHCLYTWFDNSERFGTCPMDRRRLFVMPSRANGRDRSPDGSHPHGDDESRLRGADEGARGEPDRMESRLNARAAEFHPDQSNYHINEADSRTDRHSGTEQTAGVASEALFQDGTVQVHVPRS